MVLLRERVARRGIGAIEPCLPSPAKEPPSGAGWIHEIKHDGFTNDNVSPSGQKRQLFGPTPIRNGGLRLQWLVCATADHPGSSQIQRSKPAYLSRRQTMIEEPPPLGFGLLTVSSSPAIEILRVETNPSSFGKRLPSCRTASVLAASSTVTVPGQEIRGTVTIPNTGHTPAHHMRAAFLGPWLTGCAVDPARQGDPFIQLACRVRSTAWTSCDPANQSSTSATSNPTKNTLCLQ
jgi:hypothetical protein